MPIIRRYPKLRFVCIGKVLRPQGTAGALRVANYSDLKDRFVGLDVIYIGPVEELVAPYPVDEVREAGKHVIVTLANRRSIEAVEDLCGQYCFIPEEQREPLEEDHYYIEELVGMQVRTPDGESLGEVKAVKQNPANDLLVVDGPRGEALVPMVDAFVRRIDFDTKTIEITPIEGLFD